MKASTANRQINSKNLNLGMLLNVRCYSMISDGSPKTRKDYMMRFISKVSTLNNSNPVGQIHLPLESMTTLEFLIQICKGQKKTIRQSDVIHYNLPTNDFTTKKRLGTIIKNTPTLQEYFPDDVLKHTDKQFVIDVINTLDPDYFPKCTREIEESMVERSKKKNETISLDAHVFDFLQSLMRQPGYMKSGSGGLKLSKGPRKKPERQAVPEL